MKTNNSTNNVKLGLFVTMGALFLVFSLYMIGRNQNLFGPTFTVTVYFANINGLVPGNNVRFSGINVGTVKEITINSDSAVAVTLIIEKRIKGFIKQNTIASIGTDGLMGNKLVNLNATAGSASPIEDGSILKSQGPVETDEMLRTLKVTNDNIAVITGNFKEISTRLNGSNSLWSILGDTLIAYHLKSGVSNFNKAGENVAELTANADRAVQKFSNGNGLASSLFTDTLLRKKLEETITSVRSASSTLNTTATELKNVVGTMRTGKGPVATLLNDSLSSAQLRLTFQHVEQGTARFDENMEAMKHNFLFRGYFRKLEKQNKKEQDQKPVNNGKE